MTAWPTSITISVTFLVRVLAQPYFLTITHSAYIVVVRKIIVLVKIFWFY